MLSIRAALALILVFACTAAQADRLVMKDGSVLVGKVISADEDQVTFDTTYAGELSIKQSEIDTMVTEEEVDVLLKDGSLFKDKMIVSQEGEMLVMNGEDTPVPFDIPDIRMVNPEPWRIGEGYKWSGRTEFSMETERGNSDTDELDFNLESIWRSLHDRYTVRGLWEVDKSNDVRNKYLWNLRGKYDRFRKDDPDNYVGFLLSFEHDEFQDLDLRTAAGPYIGREFYDTAVFHANGEIGVVYVDEQFKVAEDSDYWGGAWELRMTWEPFADFEFYANQNGLISFSNTSDLIVNSTVGVRFPSLLGLTTAAEAVYEYDGGAVEGVDTVDETYKFKVGYSW